jgi:hypothetical protein
LDELSLTSGLPELLPNARDSGAIDDFLGQTAARSVAMMTHSFVVAFCLNSQPALNTSIFFFDLILKTAR